MKSGSILIILFGWFCGILSTNSYGQDTPNSVRGVKDDQTGTAKTTGNQYALVVGVSKYHNIQTLLYADDDASSFKDFLLDTKLVPEANIHTLIDSTATRSKFYAEIKKIMDKLKENDRVIIYFAGHGDVDNDIDAGFLLGYNCEATPYAASDAIDISMLERYVDAITKKNVKVILISDACRSGKLTGGAHGAELTLTALSSRFKNTIKILSCGPGELSEETNFRGGGHGIFTYYLLEALYGLADYDNNNEITKKELDKFLKDKVPKATGDRQNPIIEGNANEVILEVTPELKLAMVAKANAGADAKSVATRSFSQKSYNGISINDSVIIKKFYNQLRDGKLNTPEGDNAYETFLAAKKVIANNDLVNSMKYDLAAGLEDDVQPLLNRFTRGEFQDYPFDLFGIANKKLQIIKSDLITPDDYRYNDIEALQIFFSKAGYYTDDVLYDLRRADSILPNTAYINCEIARCYSERSVPDTANAFKYFRKSMQLAPTWPFPHLIAGLLYMDLNMYDEAKVAFEKALSIKNDFKLALINTGVLYSRLKDDDKEISYYRKALEIPKPESVVLYSNIGLYWKNKENYDSALYYQRIGYRSNPDNSYNITGLINSFIKFKLADSIKYYKKQLEDITPSTPEEFRNIGITYYDLEDYDKALEYYNKALAIKENSDVYNNIGLTYEKLENKQMAKKNYALAVQIRPNYAIGLNNLALMYNNESNYDSAIYYYRKAYAITPADMTIVSGMASSFAGALKKDSALFYLEKLKKGSKATDAEDLRKIGDVYVDLLNYDEAINYYIKALAVKPSSFIDNNLGLAYENQQKVNEAKKYYLAALQLDPDYSTSTRNVALLYAKAGQYDSALYFFRKRFNVNPNDISNLASMLSNFAKLGQKDSVSFYAKKLEIIKTDDPTNIRKIADAFLDIPDYDKAMSFYYKAIAIKPSTDIYNNLALAYEGLDKNDEAKKYYKLAVNLQPDYATSIRNLAILYNRFASYDTALYYYRKLYAITPSNISNTAGFAKVFLKLKQNDSALFYLNKLKSINADDPSDLRSIGDVYLDLPDYQKAISYYNKAIAIKPAEDIYNNLALAYEDLERDDDAKKYYQLAIKLKPDYVLSMRNLANLYYRIKNYDSAAIYFKRIIEISAKPTAANYNSLADALYSKSSYDSAIVYYKKAIALDDSHSNYFVNMGAAYYYLQQYPESVPYLEKAFAMDTSYISSYPKLAYGYMSVKKYDDAINLYNKILKIDTTGQSIYYYNIACAKSIQQKTDEALYYFDRSIKTGYTDLEHFSEDTDLDNIRSLPAFKKIVETYYKKEEIDKFPKLYIAK